MSSYRSRQELSALGEPPFQPTDYMREMCRMHVLNGLGEDQIAALFGISRTVLRYHFARELDHTKAQILAECAGRMVGLARQTEDLGVCFRANALVLQSRLKTWRIPSADAPDDQDKPLESMSLAELQRELSRLRSLPENPGARAPEDDGEGELDGVVQDGGV